MKSLFRIQVLFALAVLIVLPVASVLPQSFEGTIIYVQDVGVSGTFKKMGVTKEMILEKVKEDGTWFDTVRVFYRQGDYASIGNNDKKTSKIYQSSENKIYSFDAKGGDICAVQDAVDLNFDGTPDKPTVTDLDSAVTVMGMPCKVIRMKWDMSQVDYYYNTSQAHVNPDLFSKHSNQGFSEFVKRTKCLPMQVVLTSMGMMVIQTATGIKPGKVSSEIFTIPALVEDESLNLMKVPGVKAMRVKK